MGNQLQKSSQIFPVEHYIQDPGFKIAATGLPEITFHSNLGSTRFFKVAKCDSDAGPVVVKVFVIHDPNNELESRRDRLRELRDTLAPTFNCLPFSTAILTEKAGFVIRQFGKYSLYDRISTRPFLTNLEKRWLAFQLLLAVEQCHRLGVCHGDIKLENIMVSSWSWLTLTDFASFKPTFLPEDNPADFSYFFDTSRRRVCCIAPERFVSRVSVSESVAGPGPDTVAAEAEAQLVPSMDVFSVGCCIGELFTDGIPVFDFSQMLEFRVGKFSPDKILDKIDDENVRNLVSHMINKEPGSRLTVEEYLKQERGKVFPEDFYTFLQPYIGMFSRPPLMSSDQKVQRIHKDLSHYESLMASADPSQKIEPGSLLIVANVVISCVRSLRLTTSQMACLDILQWLSSKLSSEVILERLLPQIIHFLSTSSSHPPEPLHPPTVTAHAVSVLVACLGHVSHVPRSDANTFPEYILPVVSPLTRLQGEASVGVRYAVARHLASIAALSTSWLDMIVSSCPPGQAATDYHRELSTLHKIVEAYVTTLLEDQKNSVKQVLVTESAAKLAVWLGRQKANDVLLSHMITFLNDKEDSHLRYCFYDNIAGVASFVGWHCSSILKPLLEQGLGDPEEMVVCRTVSAMSDLVAQGLLEKVAVFDMLKATTPFLLHPNLWIRQSTAGLVAAVAGKLDTVDIQVKLASIVAPFLEQSLVQVEVPHLLLAHCKKPVPRAVLETVVRCPDTMALLAVLEERQTARKLARVTGGALTQQPVYAEMSSQLKPLFGRLAEAGMLPCVEDKVLALRDYIVKMARGRGHGGRGEQTGLIECGLNPRKCTVRLAVEEPRRSDSGEVRLQSEAAEEADLVPLQAPCRTQLDRVISDKRAEHDSVTERQDRLNTMARSVPAAGWRPRGVLVAHLAEHKSGVTRLATIPGQTLVASTSSDGTLRIWDVAKMESGKNIANRARQVYNRHVPLDGVAASGHNNCLATAARDGSLSVFNIEKQSMVASRNLSLEEEGGPVDMVFCDLGPAPLLFYSTTFGSIVGWDLRKPGHAVSFRQDLRHGLTTAMAVAGEETWLAAGTSSGVVTVWDLRFRLQVGGFTHPNKARVRRLGSVAPGQLVVAVQGNNEVGVWSVESSSRQSYVTAAGAGAGHSVTAMALLAPDSFITGGTDCAVRCWHLGAPHPETVSLGGEQCAVASRLVEGATVYTESARARGEAGEGAGHQGRISADIQHTDWVTDMALCQSQQTLLVTASNDGVMKIWK